MSTHEIPEQQYEVTRLCIQCALLLLQHGAETALVEQLSTRLGLALEMEGVESAISANAIVLTTIYQGHCLTTTRKSLDRGINMHVVAEVQHIVIGAERHQLTWQQVKEQLNKIQPNRYPNWLVILLVGASCACFCRLAGGGLAEASVTFIAAAVAMFVRQRLTAIHINPIISFGITAFVATLLCGLIIRIFPIPNHEVAMASCILLLVPGFPLINAISDMFKGHVNTGIARWTVASLLALTTCIGVVIALSILGIKGWV
ncbi:threonine/serine ThrE exporter family protein [Neisseria sp. Ec49-e6-T10]|uniref:threonine/serine ThrE exporter family protein n=1 Tax=Neisseria sp. Ec49-e6-T10 TaxID=3140744 RepID=UPI003EB8717A